MVCKSPCAFKRHSPSCRKNADKSLCPIRILTNRAPAACVAAVTGKNSSARTHDTGTARGARNPIDSCRARHPRRGVPNGDIAIARYAYLGWISILPGLAGRLFPLSRVYSVKGEICPRARGDQRGMKRTISYGLVYALLAATAVALGAQEASQSNPYQGTSNPPPDDTITTPAAGDRTCKIRLRPSHRPATTLQRHPMSRRPPRPRPRPTPPRRSRQCNRTVPPPANDARQRHRAGCACRQCFPAGAEPAL